MLPVFMSYYVLFVLFRNKVIFIAMTISSIIGQNTVGTELWLGNEKSLNRQH